MTDKQPDIVKPRLLTERRLRKRVPLVRQLSEVNIDSDSRITALWAAGNAQYPRCMLLPPHRVAYIDRAIQTPGARFIFIYV